MHKLYFYNSYGNGREIAAFEGNMTDEEVYDAAFDEIKKFCDNRNFTVYYLRLWNTNEDTIVDVGSHTEFFHINPKIDITG
jgi:hypothetical protein